MPCTPNCGACCDPVTFDPEAWDRVREYAAGWLTDNPNHGDWVPPSDDPAWRGVADALFITRHWTQRDEEPGSSDCEFFDPAARTCGAYDDRPPICRDYPFYNGSAADAYDWAVRDRVGCGYIVDVPVAIGG